MHIHYRMRLVMTRGEDSRFNCINDWPLSETINMGLLETGLLLPELAPRDARE